MQSLSLITHWYSHSHVSQQQRNTGTMPPNQGSMSNQRAQTFTKGLPVPVPSSRESHVAADYEETHVHGVYEAIAPHFSATRHKPWPFVSSFLASQPPGSIGLDVGCGNGKNMGVNRDVVILGCDRSAALVALARDMWCTGRGANSDGHGRIIGADVAVADGLQLPFREASVDFVICIAVIHHLSTRDRRVEAIKRLLWCIRRKDPLIDSDSGSSLDTEKRSGQVLVYVWALEQSSSRRGWDKDSEQDLLVPWVMKAPQQKKAKTLQPPKSRKNRQSSSTAAGHPEDAATCGNKSSGEGGEHMQGRRQQSRGSHSEGGTATAAADANADAGALEDAATSRPSRKQSTGDDAEKTNDETSSDGPKQQQGLDKDKDQTFHRFYHLYKEGELEEDIMAAGGKVLQSGYERDNWWVIAC